MKYKLARWFFGAALHTFYSRVSMRGQALPSTNDPVLFIANHCNAFIDPLLLTVGTRRYVTFTAKSTLARNPLLHLIIKAFSVELLSRQMDRKQGDNGIAHNGAALGRLQKKLLNNGAVFIFPEGRSHNDTRLHAFKKGAARLALAYEKHCAESGLPCRLQVVPLAITYSIKSVFRSTAQISVGEAISIKHWVAEHPERNASTLTDYFKQRVEAELVDSELNKHDVSHSRQALHTSTEPELYELGCGESASVPGKPLREADFNEKALTFTRTIEKRCIGLPFAILGSIINALPFAVTAGVVKKMSTDHDHPASVAVVTGPLIFVLLHFMQLMLIAAVFTAPTSVGLILLYWVLLWPSTVLALRGYDEVVGGTRSPCQSSAW